MGRERMVSGVIVPCFVIFSSLVFGATLSRVLIWHTGTTTAVADAHDTREQALAGSRAPADVLARQVVLNVSFWGMDAKEHAGQLVVDSSVAPDLRAIFHELDSVRFPIQSMLPIVHFQWSDDASIAANNTSAFNYRVVEGTTRLSNHAFGKAVDINPWLNPWVGHRTATRPYNPSVPGTICEGSFIVKAFTKRGWTWGGHWAGAKDYQHFDKR